MGTFVFILFLAYVVWYGFVQFDVRKRVDISTPLGRLAVQEIIDGTFGSTWKRTGGPGTVNVTPKIRVRAPTLSIDVGGTPSGGCSVNIWISAFTTRYGLIPHAQLIWRKRRALSSKLDSAPTTSGGSTASSTSSPPWSKAPTDFPPPPPHPPPPPPPPSSPWYGAQADSSSQSSSNANRSSSSDAVRQPLASANFGPAELFLRIVQESDTNIVLRTARTPAEVAGLLRRTIASTQIASATHLLIGPPRATMWVQFECLASGETLMVASLMTRDDPDRDFVQRRVVEPIRAQMGSTLDGALNVVSGATIDGALRSEILTGRVIGSDQLEL